MSEAEVGYFTNAINVDISSNEGDFIIWDNCNRFIPVSIDDLQELICKLTKLEEYLSLKDEFDTVDPQVFMKPVPLEEEV